MDSAWHIIDGHRVAEMKAVWGISVAMTEVGWEVISPLAGGVGSVGDDLTLLVYNRAWSSHLFICVPSEARQRGNLARVVV